MDRIHRYTIALIRFVLSGDIPEKVDDIDFEQLYEFSKSHGVENMIYVGLRDLKIEVPDVTMHKFKEAYEMAIMTEAVQALELEAISQAFEEAGIDHVPLKGSVVKYLYPMPDYRKSGDIDILVNADDEKKINDILVNMGYSREADYEGHDVHFAYWKPPFMEIEIHRRLVRKNNRANEFCLSVWDNVREKSGYNHLYYMNDDFFYVYMLAHLCKHLYAGGAGIRLITDIWIMLEKINLNKDVLQRYLRKANLTEINNMILKLVNNWFGNDLYSDRNIDILEKLVFIGGSFGNIETREIIKNNDSYGNKIINFMKMVFPSAKTLEGKYPILKGKMFLLPLVWSYRGFIILTKKRDSASLKIKDNFNNEKKDEVFNEIVNAIKSI